MAVEIRQRPDEIGLSFFAGDVRVATSRFALTNASGQLDARRSGDGLAINLATNQGRWALRLLPVPGEAMLQIVEVSSLTTGAWEWEFTGPTAHVQKQISAVTDPVDGQRFGFGGFTQHGQIGNLKDWFFVEQAGQCTGLLSLRPGTWTHPATTAGSAIGKGQRLRVRMPFGGRRVRRSFLLAHAPAEQVLSLRQVGCDGMEPPEGYVHWPARIVTRYGFARPERLRAYPAYEPARPARFAFGDDRAMARAINRARGEDELTANPLWAGRFDQAREWMFKTLRQLSSAVLEGGYLHPLGTPVACRPLGAAAGMFHMLDFLGELSDADRRSAAGLIATLAELLFRRDFYPHDFATESPEFPYTDKSVYRGMLNQNFNTDRYAFVGLAGCVLRDHPHAARWRRHAVQQFEAQMRAYVWPGGCWEESHTYANHVKMTLLPLVLALRHAPEPVDLMANENFLATCRFFIQLLSPPTEDGYRLVPAIGDHQLHKHDDFNAIFGWMATLCPAHRDEFLWAWREQGSSDGEAASMQFTTFSPLMLPDRDVLTPAAPTMRSMRLAPGYGAHVRREFGTDRESLLVVRCGPAWGHYHNDQGSFWWWVHGRLICCDAGAGDGSLKFAHHGHNVPGYVGREPRQWLDRHPYEIDRCEQTLDGSAVIGCQIPVVQWMDSSERHEQIPPEQRPHVTRTFEWAALDQLRITDAFVRSPDGLATFSLHVIAREVRLTGPTTIEFDLEAGKLQLQLPAEPKAVQFHRVGSTCGLTCTYAEAALVHLINVHQ